MQRKGNVISRVSQVDNLATAGIDMGGALWATTIRDRTAGRDSFLV
jgi:hypothetical protein